MTNKELWKSGPGGRIRYKTPASVLWVEGEIRKLEKRVEVLRHQNTRLLKRVHQVVEARKRYDTVTVERRWAREAERSRFYKRVSILWEKHQAKIKDIYITPPSIIEHIEKSPPE